MAEDKQPPKVSVIMPVYNVEPYLRQAIDSILEQTFTDFELIAIDDGSTDNSGKILDEYQQRDDRLIVIHQTNQGVVATANTAMSLARGTYIARQDSDDISFSTRLERQVGLLDTHPDVIMATGCFEVFDEEDEYLYREILPTLDQDIKRAMYLRNPIGHGSVMVRKEAYEAVGPYDKDGKTKGLGEDFELFIRLAPVGTFMGIESATYRWRMNTRGLTNTKNKLMEQVANGLIDELWARQFPPLLSPRELRERGNYYYHTYPKRGIAMKNMMLADNAQLAVKMLKRGHPLKALRQLFSVMLVGRAGVRAVLFRIHALQKGTAGAIRRRATAGRRDTTLQEQES